MPGRARDESGEGEPVEVFVLLEVGVGENDEGGEEGRNLKDATVVNRIPDLAARYVSRGSRLRDGIQGEYEDHEPAVLIVASSHFCQTSCNPRWCSSS